MAEENLARQAELALERQGDYDSNAARSCPRTRTARSAYARPG